MPPWRSLILTNATDFDRISVVVRRVVREVEGAALEMLCGETHLGFESLTLRQIKGKVTKVTLPFMLQKRVRDSKGRKENAPVEHF